MRILLDECVPRPIRRELIGHDVWTIRDMGWAGKKNGELLACIVADSRSELAVPTKFVLGWSSNYRHGSYNESHDRPDTSHSRR
jgi:hypothetical protein